MLVPLPITCFRVGNLTSCVMRSLQIKALHGLIDLIMDLEEMVRDTRIKEDCRGVGVLNMAVQAVSRMARINGIADKHQFYLIDKDGLVTKDRKTLDPAAASFAKYPEEIEGLREGANLAQVVRKVKPDVLLGLSGVGGIKKDDVLPFCVPVLLSLVFVIYCSADSIERAWQILDQIPGRATGAYSHSQMVV